MPVIETSVPQMLRERAHLSAGDIAFTFLDYEQDPAGSSHHLTWSQVYHRACLVAEELSQVGSPGDRALILAPQGPGYVTAFLGALQAGFIAVPLSLLDLSFHTEHISTTLRDAAPRAILTTSSAAPGLANLAQAQNGHSAPALIEVDTLNTGARANERSLAWTGTAYLQYTSGSTRQPAGVEVSHRNLHANFAQVMANYFDQFGNVAPSDTTVVSWVPLYHNMGLFIGLCAPILAGLHTVLFDPVSFLQQPSRWMRLLATNSRAFSPTPNFALELAAKSTTDEDMGGLDLSDVLAIIAGGERIHPATLEHFTTRFGPYNLRNNVIRPSYGLAEATVYVATRPTGQAPEVVGFDPELLTAGQAKRTRAGGTRLVSYGVPGEPAVRIVDADSGIECSPGTVGEIWVHGDNVAGGYWHKPEQTDATFGATIVAPSAGTPASPWLRTGDLGALSDGELFIMGRIKDVLIIYGRNHYPDDIEATVEQITGGRVAAISVQRGNAEQLVVIVELADADQETRNTVKREITSALSGEHALAAADLLLVAPGTIPSTASGKIRRAACVERYLAKGFNRLDD